MTRYSFYIERVTLEAVEIECSEDGIEVLKTGQYPEDMQVYSCKEIRCLRERICLEDEIDKIEEDEV